MGISTQAVAKALNCDIAEEVTLIFDDLATK